MIAIVFQKKIVQFNLCFFFDHSHKHFKIIKYIFYYSIILSSKSEKKNFEGQGFEHLNLDYPSD